MKKTIFEFMRRGIVACGLGPLILAIIYLIMQRTENIQTLTVQQVCLGIISLSTLAFIVGGMNVIYQIEQLPLMIAILIHGSVLYVSYLITYLLNNWLERGLLPILVFTAIFIIGYLVIWAIIYSIIRTKTNEINKMLEKKQHC